MAYPVVSAPYGLKPINLVGGQVFAGSTREYAIPYGYATNIFYGDLVGLSRGNIERLTVSTGTLGTVTGVFLGCSYTNPTTKQKTFAQYYPASTSAGDIMAIVCDDPDTVFKAVACSATTAVASTDVAAAAAARAAASARATSNWAATSRLASAGEMAATSSALGKRTRAPARKRLILPANAPGFCWNRATMVWSI